MGFKKGPGWEERDDRERHRDRYDMAFKLARQEQARQRKELEKRGIPKEEADKLVPKVGQLADFYAKTRAKELDDLVKKQKEALGQGASKSKKSLGNLGQRTAGEINNAGARFKDYLQGKRDLKNREKERNDTGERKTPAREKSTTRETGLPKRREGQESQNQSDSKSSVSVKDMFKQVRELQRERVPLSKSEEKDVKTYRGKELEKYHEIDYYHPTIRGEKVSSYKHLQEIVDKEFPGCKRIKNFDKLMEGARKHLELGTRLEGKTHLDYGEIAKISKEIDQDIGTVQDWTKKQKQPKLYPTLESAISKSEGLSRLEKLIRENNGIKNMDDIQRRLGHYYAENEYRDSLNYKKDLEMAEKYLKFCDLLKEGGSITEIGRQINFTASGCGRWLRGDTPWMIQLASSIPDTTPKDGHKWLPVVTGPKNNPSGFIEVPTNVKTWKDVEHVLKQLKSINSPKIHEYEKRFGQTTKEDSIMYVLGSLLSDGNSRFTSETNTASSRFSISLGKRYSWSIDYGDGTCYHLSKIGVSAGRGTDVEPTKDSTSYPNHGAYLWKAEANVLTSWLRRSCLGLKDSDSKTFDSVNAQWVLSTPEEFRISFLQGVCDGDGCTSLMSQYLSIATSSNFKFYQDLLESFGIDTHEGDGAVVISSRESIRRSHEIGIFRYASSRKEDLDKLIKMFDTIDNSLTTTPEEMKHIAEQRKLGKSWGAISESLYDRFGHTWPHYTVQNRYEKPSAYEKKGGLAQSE